MAQSLEYLTDKLFAARIGVSRSTIWRLSHDDPEFPQPVKLTGGSTRWRVADIDNWLEQKHRQAA